MQIKIKIMKVEFIKSPTGKFNLAYSPGQTGDVAAELGKELIAKGYAKAVGSKKKAAPKTKK